MRPRCERRVACVWIPHFVAELERTRRLGMPDPLVVADGDTVLGVDALAQVRGVAAGDTLQQAQARCPEAVILPAAPDEYESAWEQTLEALGRHSPAVEPETWGSAWMDAGGMLARYGSEEAWCAAVRDAVRAACGLESHVGVAGGKFTASVASRLAGEPGVQRVDGRDRAFLAPLSVDWLPFDPDTRRRLRILGIHTLGRLARLSAVSVAEQFGPECAPLHRWAQGIDDRPVLAQRRRSVEAAIEFEVPTDQREPILAAATHLGRRLLPALVRQGLAPRRVELMLRTAGGEWVRSAPVAGSLGPDKLRAVLEGILGNAETRNVQHKDAKAQRREGERDGPTPLSPFPQEGGDGEKSPHSYPSSAAAGEGGETGLSSSPLPRTGEGRVRAPASLSGPVAEVRVRLLGLGAAVDKQIDLFAHTEARRRLDETLRIVARRCPPGCIVRVRPLDPDALLAAERYHLEEVAS